MAGGQAERAARARRAKFRPVFAARQSQGGSVKALPLFFAAFGFLPCGMRTWGKVQNGTKAAGASAILRETKEERQHCNSAALFIRPFGTLARAGLTFITVSDIFITVTVIRRLEHA